MAVSLRASRRGLQIVDQARKKKNWTKRAAAWCAAALVGEAALKKFWARVPIERDRFESICRAVGVENWEEIVDNTNEPIPHGSPLAVTKDWGEAPDVSVFYGRNKELTTLEQWIVSDRCRLVALLGIGGIGKTALCVRLAKQIQGEFKYLIWRSLRYAPPVEDLLTELIRFLSNDQETDLPKDIGRQVTMLIQYLRSHRCLLILDEAETILQTGEIAGQYRKGYEGYGELLKRVAEQMHNSCLVLTTQEKPKDVASQERNTQAVRSLQLGGLKEAEAREIFRAKRLSDPAKWVNLIRDYRGNPLFLNILSAYITDLFNGNVLEFLKLNTILCCDDIRPLLDLLFERLSHLEKEIMYQLANSASPISIPILRQEILPPVSGSELMEALKSLEWRSLIEKHIEGNVFFYTLQPLMRKYLHKRKSKLY